MSGTQSFLHGTAYAGGQGTYVGLYQVQYTDGTTADLPLENEINIRDWASAPGPFLREKETTSVVAWTGSCPMFSVVGLYRMLWVNPRPEVAVRAVRFANPARSAVPVLLGLTAVVPRESNVQVPQASATAQALLAQATQAAEAKDDARAHTLLQEALAADPSLSAAHQALADFLERKGDEDAAYEAYRAWTASGAATPLPYNRVGQILEKRKDYRGALDAYTKSLEIEWNQPPVIEARRRLEAMERTGQN